MSAAECHLDADKQLVGEAYVRRIQDIIAYPDELLIGRKFAGIADPQERRERIAEGARQLRHFLRQRTAEQMGNGMRAFGVMNHPLPPR